MPQLRVLLYANVDGGEAGGVQAVTRSLAEYLGKAGHHVTTGWAAYGGGPPSEGWAEAFHVRRAGRWLHLRTMARLALRLLRERPQVVNIHFASPSALYFIKLARVLGFRVVVTCHGSDILRPLPHDAPFLRQVIEGADAVTVVSGEIAAMLAQQGLKPRRGPDVIANGVDTEFWQPGPRRKVQNGLPVLVAVGRLEEVKGFDLLIAACGTLARQGTPVRLTIIGEGSQAEGLAAQAKLWGNADHVTFAGRLPRDAIRAHLHDADLYVLPSRSEGMPLALMEAMAAGAPAVAFDVGGVAATAAGSARLVAPENPAALAQAIAELIADPVARAAMRKAGLARAQDFTVAGAHAAYEALMFALVRPGRT